MDITKDSLGGNHRQGSRINLDWLKIHWLPITLGLFFGLILSLAMGIALPLRGVWQQAQELKPKISEIKAAVSEKDLTKIKTKINETETELAELDRRYEKLFLVKHLPYFKKYYQDGEHAFSAAKEGLEAGKLVVESIEPYQDFLGIKEATESAELDNGEKTTEERIDFLVEGLESIKPKMGDISDKLSKADSYLNEIDPNDYPEKFRGMEIRATLIKAKNMVKDVNLLVTQGGPLIEKADWLMGVEEPRNYFLLFQNDGELRPTGGFWTAYGVLEVDDGDVIPQISEDIYALDARFGNKLEAPQPIKDYHKDVYYWHLRDMNLSPSFKESVETFTKYYQELPNAVEYDAVFALDTQVLVDLVDALGGIGVPGWGNFTSEPDDRCWGCPQVIYKLEEYADRPLSTTRSSRKAFLSPLMHSIIANALGSPKEKVAQLAQVVLDNFKEKHLLVYFPDEELQQAAEKLNIAGTLKSVKENRDYFYLNDTNFAGAKSNLFIDQEVVQDYKIENEKITKTVTVTYKNTAPASNCNLEAGELCLNGLYRNWMRFYVPEGSKLIEMKGSEIEPRVYSEYGKTVFEGFYGDKYPLYPKGSTKVTLSYELPFEPQKTLPVTIEKQPGTHNPSYEILVNGQSQQKFNLTSDQELQISL
jgi:hypothetical protein